MEKVYWYEYYPHQSGTYKAAVVLTLPELEALAIAFKTDRDKFDTAIDALEARSKATLYFGFDPFEEKPNLVKELKNKKTIGGLTEEGSYAMSLVSMGEAKAMVRKIEADQLDLDETMITEKWAEPAKIAKKDQGKFKGEKMGELRDELAALKKKKNHTDADTKRIKELNFAIRAKTGWGKVKESTENITEGKVGENSFMTVPYKEGTIKVEYEIYGKYSPASMSGPEEYPEFMIYSAIDEAGNELVDTLTRKDEEYIQEYIDSHRDKDRPRGHHHYENITENKINEMSIKEKQIALVEAKIEQLSGKKVVYKEAEVLEEAHACSCKKNKLTEAKDDEKESKKEDKEEKGEKVAVKAPKAEEGAPAMAATENADEPILGNIIPTSVIKQIDAYVSDTLAEIDKATTQLRAIKRQITSGATATNEDFSTLTDRIAFLVKQLSRISLYTSNTIKAGKFDKGLLDKIFDQKGLVTPTI